MNTSTALKPFQSYQKSNLKPGTGISYRYVLDNFEELFQFLELLTEDTSKVTKNHRYAQLRALFNFIYEL